MLSGIPRARRAALAEAGTGVFAITMGQHRGSSVRPPDVSVVTLALDADRFNPELTSVSGLDVWVRGPGEPERPPDDDLLADSVVTVTDGPALQLPDPPHELGHALFNLSDEYVGQVYGFDGRADPPSWPSCAEDESRWSSQAFLFRIRRC